MVHFLFFTLLGKVHFSPAKEDAKYAMKKLTKLLAHNMQQLSRRCTMFFVASVVNKDANESACTDCLLPVKGFIRCSCEYVHAVNHQVGFKRFLDFFQHTHRWISSLHAIDQTRKDVTGCQEFLNYKLQSRRATPSGRYYGG